MDRETTQRLLRDSIIFLCKTYLGADAASGFEIDSIICLSRRNRNVGDTGNTGFDDPRPVVFKFHEFVTEEHLSALDDSQFYQSSMGDGLWRLRGLPHDEYGAIPSAINASKKRKVGEAVAGDKFADSAKKSCSAGNAEHINLNGIAQDLSNIKQEVVWSHDSDLCETLNLRLTKTDFTAKMKPDIQNADKNVLKRRDPSSGFSSSSSLINSSSTQANCSKSQPAISSAGETSSVESRPLICNIRTLNSKSLVHEGKAAAEKSEDGSITKSRDAMGQDGIDSSSSMEQSVPRSCDVCYQLFSDFPKFNVHCTSVHGRFACPFCELSFPHESARERHLFEHTGEPVDEDSVSDELTSPASAERSNMANANFEGHSAMSSSAIDLSSENEDELMGTNDTYFESHLLSRRGTISTHALRAIASLDPSRPFVCDVCRAQFEESSELCDHCALVHRRIPCPYCGRSFSQKASMERHQRQHTGERPYQCTMCHLSYTRKENLQTHYSRAHSMSAGAASSMHHPDFVDLE